MPSLQQTFPWTKSPIVVNAPMGGIAGPRLAEAVTRAGGIGLMGMVESAQTTHKWLDEIESAFPTHTHLPVGIGFLAFLLKLETVVEVLTTRHQQGKKPPAIIWLFAANEPSVDVYSEWSRALRAVYTDFVPQIWVQVGGSAERAAAIAKSGHVDAIVVQGSDAGGHGTERGAGIISLLPETLDLIGERSVHVLASGGIVDARGVLAALSLGADGVVMGTRFLTSPETLVPHPIYAERVLSAKDGAMSTIRAKIFDELKGPNIWPVEYDGRALVSQSWKDMSEGVGIETIRHGYAEAVKSDDHGFAVENDRAVVWAGSGVGMVNDVRPAGELVKEIRDGVIRLSEKVSGSIRGKL